MHTSQRLVAFFILEPFNSFDLLQLSDKIQEFCIVTFQKPATSHVLSHLRRELVHQVWSTLLDDEFTDAYTNGILIEFNDGVVRRVFPRIFTYSADYPEK